MQDDQQAPGSSVAAAGKSLLTKADLENNFAYSLSDAARRLGVSNTTVKRACRSDVQVLYDFSQKAMQFMYVRNMDLASFQQTHAGRKSHQI